MQVGRVPLYLLDTNIDANSRPEDRDLTDQLYGGDREMRIRQEILLGIGGYRALQALGLQPTVYHMNEGHSAFLALEHIRHLMQTRSSASPKRASWPRPAWCSPRTLRCEAGHDYFDRRPDGPLLRRYAPHDLGLSQQDFLRTWGAVPKMPDFCMTVLALRSAARANGVSKLHGEVSRKMWQSLWPGVPVDEIPIGHVTNGVHFRSWISAEFNQLYDRYLGPNWREEPANQRCLEPRQVHSRPRNCGVLTSAAASGWWPGPAAACATNACAAQRRRRRSTLPPRCSIPIRSPSDLRAASPPTSAPP